MESMTMRSALERSNRFGLVVVKKDNYQVLAPDYFLLFAHEDLT